MSEDVKNDLSEPEVLDEKPSECNNDPETKMIPLYTKLLERMSMVSLGLLIFILAFVKATRISEFNTTKLILLEICLLVLLVFIVGISIVLATMRYKWTANKVVALLIYVSALFLMVLILLLWAFFKASSVGL